MVQTHTLGTPDRWLKSILFVALAVLLPWPANAQSDLSNTLGLQQDRNYFSPEGFEHLDTLSTNVVLTFVDLSLPGNGGRSLQFQRSYNNAINVDNQATRWSFGIAGMVMRVIERDPIPLAMTLNDDPAYLTGYAPVLVAADGARYKTMFVQRPLKELFPLEWKPETIRFTMSAQFQRYDTETNTLYMPDGTIARYTPRPYPEDQQLDLTEYEDAFGNLVTLSRSPGLIAVTQHLGNGQSRAVTLSVDAEGRVLSMAYDGRVWTYTYQPRIPSLPDGAQEIASVTPPIGSGWAFEHSATSTDLTKITTPNGGRIEYSRFTDGASSYLHRDTFDRNGTHLGRWEAILTNPFNHTIPDVLTVRLPGPGGGVSSGETIKFHHSDMALGPTDAQHAMAGNFGMTARQVFTDSTESQQLELMQRTYTMVPSIRYDSNTWWGTPEIQTYTIKRYFPSERVYTTNYTYDTSVNAASPGYWNGHRPLTVSENNGLGLSRTTTRTYDFRSTPFILGLPSTESVTVGTESFQRSWSYNPSGFLTQATTYGIPTTYQPDVRGNLQSVTTATLKTTSFLYSYGQVQQTLTSQHVTTRVINPDGTLASETQAGRTTQFLYDALFRPILVTPPAGGTTTLNEYDPNGAWVRSTRGTSQVTTSLNGFGRPTQTVDSVGVVTRTDYDAQGRVIRQGYPFNPAAVTGNQDIGTNITYDAFGRVTRETHPDASFRQYVYGPDTVTMTDEENHQTLHMLESFGNPDVSRLSSQIDPGNKVWQYTYNALGNLKTVHAEDSTSRTWTYNSANQLASEQHPESGTTTYTYDAAGALATKTDANGSVFTYLRDGNDRVTSVTTGANVTEIRYESGSDIPQWMSNGTTTTLFLYDAAGRLTQRQDAVDGKLFNTLYEYNADDSLLAIVYPGGRRIQYAYGLEQRLTQVSEPVASRDHAFGFTYHPSGAVIGYTSGNLIATQIAYDESRRWIQSISAGPLGLTYGGYDKVGNVGAITDSRPTYNQAFSYDALDRLESASGAYGVSVYAYNAHGNRVNANGSTYAYQPGTLRLTDSNGVSYTYDNNGNMLTAGGVTYTYTKQNMLATAAVAGGTAAYGYDVDDQRIKRSFGGSTTYYLRGPGGELLTEWKDPGTATGRTRDFVYAGSVLIGAVEKPTSSDPNSQCGIIVPGGPAVTITAAANQNPCLTFNGWGDHIVGVLMTPVAPTTFSGGWTLGLRRVGGALLGITSTYSATSLYLDALALPADGTYRVEIDPSGTTTGTVKIQVFDVVDVLGTIVPDGPSQTFTTSVPGQKVLVDFTGTAGRRYAVFGERLSGTACVLWALRIEKPDHSNLVSSGTCGSTLLIESTAVAQGGTYRIVADANLLDVGTIRLTLHDIDDDTTQAITPDGPAVTAGLTIGQKANFTFTGVAGRRYALRGERLTGTGCIFGMLRIYKPPSGFLLPLGDTCGTAPFLETVVVADPGTHTIMVDPDTTSTGTVRLTLNEVDTDVTGTLVINDPATPMSLTISQVAQFTFAGTQGQQVTVRLTGNTMGYTSVVLKKPDLTTLTSTATSGTNFNLTTQTLPTTGTYTVVIDPSGTATGSINVRVTNP